MLASMRTPCSCSTLPGTGQVRRLGRPLSRLTEWIDGQYFFLSSGLCVLQAHRHLGGGGQLLVPNIGLRQGVWQQITGDAFSCPHILPWATRRCPIQRTSQGRPGNQVGGLDTLALSCECKPNQVGSELQIPAHTPPLSEPLVSAAGERSKNLDVCQRSIACFSRWLNLPSWSPSYLKPRQPLSTPPTSPFSALPLPCSRCILIGPLV